MTDKNTSIYAPYFEKNDEPFFMKIGNTTYEVNTHILILMAEKMYFNNLNIYLQN